MLFLKVECVPERDFVFAVQQERSPGLGIDCINLIQATSSASDSVCAATAASAGGTLLKGVRSVITNVL